MTNTISFIHTFSPAAALPSLCLAETLLEKSSLVYLICSPDHENSIAQITTLPDQIKLITASKLQNVIQKIRPDIVEYVGWYHALGIEKAITEITSIQLTLESGKLMLSFMPDGFANVYWGPHLYMQLLSNLKKSPDLIGPAYLFFSENSISNKGISWTKPEVSPHANLSKVLRSFYFPTSKLQDVEKPLAEYADSLDIERVIFVALRPWCTSFHSGNYMFGNGAQSLTSVYEEILKKITPHGEKNTLFVFRSDGRHKEMSEQVITNLKEKLKENAYDITKDIPDSFTLESYILKFKDQVKQKYDLTLVSLDSITPFPVSALENDFDFYIGAEEEFLKSLGASDENIKYISGQVRRTCEVLTSFVTNELPKFEIRKQSRDQLLHHISIQKPQPE